MHKITYTDCLLRLNSDINYLIDVIIIINEFYREVLNKTSGPLIFIYFFIVRPMHTVD